MWLSTKGVFTDLSVYKQLKHFEQYMPIMMLAKGWCVLSTKGIFTDLSIYNQLKHFEQHMPFSVAESLVEEILDLTGQLSHHKSRLLQQAS